MPVTKADADQEQLTITVVGEFPATLESVWKLWSDPHGSGDVSDDLPVAITCVDIEPCGGGGSRMTMEGRYATAEALQQALGMGALDGATLAINQIDGLLAERVGPA